MLIIIAYNQAFPTIFFSYSDGFLDATGRDRDAETAVASSLSRELGSVPTLEDDE